jgi:diguanylate cyclase (GGDEF)-like protein
MQGKGGKEGRMEAHMDRMHAQNDGPPDEWESYGGVHFLDILIDTLQQLDQPMQQAFLEKLLKNVHKTPEPEDLTHWREILLRQKALSERLGREVNLKTAAIEYFVTTSLLRNAVLLKHRELKDRRLSADADPLTGLYNRRLLDIFMGKELGRALRHGYPLSLVLVNLENFKHAKDKHGDAVGDALLVSLACACAESVRGYDYACRVSEDEFAVLLPQSDSQGAHIVGKRIVQKFEPDLTRLAPNADLRLLYSIATAPDDAEVSTTLFDVADTRLYGESPVADD